MQSAGFRASMSRKVDCYDNAPMESFFHTLKTELVHHRRYATREDAKRDIFAYTKASTTTHDHTRSSERRRPSSPSPASAPESGAALCRGLRASSLASTAQPANPSAGTNSGL
ncbi:hypothetical protein BSZ21_23860 [Bradyrhizobium canariense]|nr:hypothetical protein BSZ21_23860 [Bradyrhizobium canariense]